MKQHKQQAGFTIVELLIVIVVIAILAAITLVAYNGVQSRAKTASAQSYAVAFQNKASAYFAVNGSYPINCGNFQDYDVSSLTGSTIWCTNPASSRPPSTLQYYSCPNGAAARIAYFDFTANQNVYIYLGDFNSQSNCTIQYGGPY